VPTIVDLSHPISDGMITYPGLPGPKIAAHLTREASRERYAPGYEFHIGAISMVGNTGTYLDVPFHRFADGYDLAELDLGRVAGVPGVVVDGADADATTTDVLGDIGDVAGRALLVRTGWSRHFGTNAYGDRSHPYLAADLTGALAVGGAAVVGIDSVSIDGTATRERPVHTALLAAGVPVIEHLTNLAALGPSGATFTFTAVPPKVVGLGTFPVRAYAMIG
jgi:kynurenine formamidase